MGFLQRSHARRRLLSVEYRNKGEYEFCSRRERRHFQNSVPRSTAV